MLQLSLSLLLFLALFAGLETAPSPSTGLQKEKLVRVYEINESQYNRVLQLTEGKKYISEARLINGGIATVTDTLNSGWNSFLRVVGLTTVTKADEAEKVDLESQPLCVIKTREGEGREENVTYARSAGGDIEAEEEDSTIHCIVVLKQDGDFELPSQDPHPNFIQYWNKPESSTPVEQPPVQNQPQEVPGEDETPEETTPAPSKKKKVNKSTYPKAADLEKGSDSSRQNAGVYLPVPPQYGAAYPPPPYGGYPYTISQPYPNPLPYPNPQLYPYPQPYGPQLPIGPSPYRPSPYGPSPYGQSPYGQVPYGPFPEPVPQPPIGPYPQAAYGPYGYPYLDLQAQLAQANAIIEVEKAEEDEDDEVLEEYEDSYESDEEDDYRYKKRYHSQKPLYPQEPYNH
ncbi:uncharacterized protein LOC108022073 [Drosophila biarmipes]|uniref:uncharacterized protein LOC108022073 n=1 Tax=Drosophila biarmipes TaxID=125945 RepID=UPI0007E60A21|nr:uncharacterized protein LOC108022073 [Drosophila biarmipes]